MGGERERGGVSDGDDGKKFSLSFLSLLPVSSATAFFSAPPLCWKAGASTTPGDHLLFDEKVIEINASSFNASLAQIERLAERRAFFFAKT